MLLIKVTNNSNANNAGLLNGLGANDIAYLQTGNLYVTTDANGRIESVRQINNGTLAVGVNTNTNGAARIQLGILSHSGIFTAHLDSV